MNNTDNIIAIRKKNPDCAYEAFVQLMDKTQNYINDKARRNPELFTGISTPRLEDESTKAIQAMCQGTPFDPEKVILVSGHSFPDIVAEEYYGVEVKATEKDKWTSIGSSILESTRAAKVEHIYMLFAKLGGTVEFLCRPYQDVLSGITVTHSPRYCPAHQ